MADVVTPPVTQAPVDTKTPEAPAEKTQEQKTEERKYKLKFGKQEREVPEAEVLALAQKGWASDEKFKAAKQVEREVKEALENGDPEYLIKKKFGKEKLEWARDVLKEELRRRTLSPEELEDEDRRKRVDDLKREEEELLSKREQEKLDAATRHYEEQYDKELAEAIKAEGLPANKYLVGRVIKIATELVQNGLEPDWRLVVREGKRQVQEELATLVDEVSDGVGFLGEDRARKLAKALVEKGMPKKEVAKVVQQVADNADTSIKKPADENEYWERKRKSWMESK